MINSYMNLIYDNDKFVTFIQGLELTVKNCLTLFEIVIQLWYGTEFNDAHKVCFKIFQNLIAIFAINLNFFHNPMSLCFRKRL